jgi:sugar phosphate isomerase/epimerase
MLGSSRVHYEIGAQTEAMSYGGIAAVHRLVTQLGLPTTIDATLQLLRVFARHRWPDTVEEQEALWRPMIVSFQELSDYAARKGVAVGLRNHDGGGFCMTADQALRILRDVDRDNFSFLMDTGQWLGAIGSDPRGEFDPNVDLYEDYLRPTAPHATYVRAKIYKIDNGTEEFLDYPRILRILREVDFNGTLGLVFELGERNACGYEECVRLAVKHLREVLASECGWVGGWVGGEVGETGHLVATLQR